jgi:hypothetical protein
MESSFKYAKNQFPAHRSNSQKHFFPFKELAEILKDKLESIRKALELTEWL